MKIKSLTNLLIATTVFFITLFAFVTYLGLSSLTGQMNKSIKEAIWFENIVNDTRQAQVDFQRQVQEWKNILVRGNDEEMYNKYLKGFEEKESKVQKTLNNVKKELLANNYKKEVESIDKLLLEHKKLGDVYRNALSNFAKEDPETGKKVDLMLRGIDRAASKAMDELAENLQVISEKELNTLKTDAETTTKNNLIYLSIISMFTFLSIVSISLYIAKNILNKLGAEPSDLSVIFSAMAKGDLTQHIEVNEKLEDSMAANAQMMQLKLRNIVVSIKNGSKEVTSVVDSVSSELENKEIMEGLIKTKHTVKGLERTIEKFKV